MFNKIFRKSQEKKSYTRELSLLQLLSGDFGYKNTPEQFIRSYIEACPVFTATKLISDACASISIVVRDKKKDEFVDHEVLKLLKNPNPFTTQNLFIKEMVSFYLLTGNDYLNIIGEKKPVELNVFNPKNINIQADARDGYAGEYTFTSAQQSFIYKRDAQKRFFDSRRNELVHLREFNPEYGSNNLIGSSSFLGCQLEISQYVAASVHNNSLLENQARPSGLLSYKGKDSLSDEQVSAVKQLLNEKLSGSSNAGKTTFLNGEFDWQQLSESVKDMDFPTLKKSTAEAIYSAVKIPLPMISPDNMSFANMDAAKYAFYDNAVIPVFKNVLAFLSKSLLNPSRYPGSENLELTYDASTIEALEARKYDNAAKIYASGLITRNEGRTLIGYEASEGGDLFYQPATLIPVGSDGFTSDNRDTPSSEKAQYINLMSNMKTADGKRLYSDEFIKKNLEIYYPS